MGEGLRKYHTRLKPLVDELRSTSPIVVDDVRIEFEPDPFERPVPHTIANMDPESGEVVSYTDFQKEIIIYAPSFIRAMEVASLIISSLSVIQGDISLNEEDFNLVPSDLEERREIFRGMLTEEGLPYGFGGLSTSRLVEACELALLAITDTELAYALHKFQNSVKGYSIPFIETHPGHCYEIYGYSEYPVMQTTFATSLINAYSVIEELSLEPRVEKGASACDALGQLKSKVRDELHQRLVYSGIDPDVPFFWIRHEDFLKLEQIRPLPTLFVYIEYKHVGRVDADLDLCDAIAYASWLRSNVCSHKSVRSENRIQYLTGYDVENVQRLARRLVLEKAGIWHRMHLPPGRRD